MRTFLKHDYASTKRPVLWCLVLSLFLFSGLNLRTARADEGLTSLMSTQQSTITGKVVDSNSGESLPGVNVMVKGTTTGTITDMDGSYSLRVTDSGAVLVFTSIGYIEQEIPVGNQTKIDVKLAEDVQALSEVVVIGYGSMKKSDLTGSVASVKSEDMIKRRPTSLAEGLQGMVSGVTIMKNSGAPGAGTSIRIRGTGSINNSNEPLWVVDGIMVGTSADWLNPNDIESIEVLKDASASAIYGSRASNGVIMVTTKQGEKGRVSLNFDANVGILTQPFRLDLANAAEYARAGNEAYTNDGVATNPIWANPSALNSIDWQDEMYGNGLSQQYNLSAAGGSQNTQAMLSLNYLNTDGILLGSDFERISARANITHNIKDFIKVGINMNYTQSEVNMTQDIPKIAEQPPTMDTLDASGNLLNVPIRYANGTWGHFPREANGFIGKEVDNLVAVNTEKESPNRNYRFFTNAFVELNILKGLTFRSNAAARYNGSSSYTYSPRSLRTTTSPGYDELSFNNSSSINYNIENYITYQFSVNAHDFSAMVGHSADKSFGQWANVSDRDYPTSLIRITSMAQNNDPSGNGGLDTETRGQSFFGRLTWAYDNRYSVTATLRRDGSSNFSLDNKYGTFASFAGAWRITEEAFMKDQNIFSNLKLRAGWGQTGNAGNTTGGYINYYSSSNIYWWFWPNSGENTIADQQKGLGFAQTTEVDTNLKWETNEMLNVGLDMGFYDNKLTASIDWYQRDTKDLLLNKQLRPSTGFTQIYTNAGHIRNTGVDFEIGYQNRWGDWSFMAKATGAIVKNEAVDIGDEIAGGQYDGDEWKNGNTPTVTRNGLPIGSYFGYRVDHIIQTQEEVDALNAMAIEKSGGAVSYYQVADTQPGDYMFKDLNGDGRITSADREVLGNGTPDLSYGLNISVGYKNWDFNLYAYGIQGRKILSYIYQNMTNIASSRGSGLQNILKEYANNAWTPTNHSTKYPRLTKVMNNDNHRISDAYLFDGSFIRLQNVQVGYTLPESVTGKLKMSSARVFASVENLFTISEYGKYGDPEVTGAVLTNGVDAGTYPNPRVFTFGISVGF